MGGLGSGRRSYANTTTVEVSLPLDVNIFAKADVFDMADGSTDTVLWERDDGTEIAALDWEITTATGMGHSECVRAADKVLCLSYTIDGSSNVDSESSREEVPVESVECEVNAPTHGEPAVGHRYYWLCPECGERRHKLYFPPTHGAGRFLCRECHGLAYQSSRISGNPRLTLLHRINNLREKLGGDRLPEHEAASAPIPEKPPQMDVKTYEHLDFEYMVLKSRYQDVRLLEVRSIVAYMSRNADCDLEQSGAPINTNSPTTDGETPRAMAAQIATSEIPGPLPTSAESIPPTAIDVE